MANTQQERQQFRTALLLIANRYQVWLSGNPNLMILLGAPQGKFDQMVKFMDNQPFMNNLRVSQKPLIGCTVNGFTDSLTDPPTIYINRDHARPSTLIHELLHYLTHPNFDKFTSSPLNEGVTEYFTRKVQGAADPNQHQDFQTQRASYNKELASVNATRGHIKNVVVPMLPFIRQQPIQLGRQRNPNFMPDPAGGVGTDDFVKRAYFKGEIAMINLLKGSSNL